jgi:hypothetical protein
MFEAPDVEGTAWIAAVSDSYSLSRPMLLWLGGPLVDEVPSQEL